MSVDPLHFFAAELARVTASGAADTALAQWQNLTPTLARFPSMSAVVAELDRADRDVDYDTVDELLHGLLLAAGSGGDASRIAATLVAARMVPAAGQVVGQLLAATRKCGRTLSVADARVTVAGCLWERVRSYPLTRTRRVAGNLRADLLRHTLIAADVHPRCTGRAAPLDPVVLTAVLTDVHPDQQASEEVLRVLAWAVGEHVLSRAQSDLLLARWADGTAPVATRVLGERMGLAQRTVAHRCARAEQLLADAVRAVAAA